VWSLLIERDDKDGPGREQPSGVVRWAVIGLAVIGVMAVLLWNYYH
jgi:hypothetical protein